VQPRFRQNLFDRRPSHCPEDSPCAGVTEPAAILLSVSSGPASLASSAAKRHWEAVYGSGRRNVSWCQPEPEMSLVLIERLQLRRDAAIIDVGGGASRLSARLLARGFTDLTVLDISNWALDLARAELGADASRVSWIEQDLLSWSPQRRYDSGTTARCFTSLSIRANESATPRSSGRRSAPAARRSSGPSQPMAPNAAATFPSCTVTLMG